VAVVELMVVLVVLVAVEQAVLFQIRVLPLEL
jgi:hypothetical protein